MDGPTDPFRTLALAYDATADDVRRAFRRLARETHPDRGGSADAFHRVRAAYGALSADLDGERRRWRSAGTGPRRRVAGGLDPREFPTCPVRVGRRRDGTRTVAFLTDRRPSAWRPGASPPPGGTCDMAVEAEGTAPAFGVWTVPLDAHRVRHVFGPYPWGR